MKQRINLLLLIVMKSVFRYLLVLSLICLGACSEFSNQPKNDVADAPIASNLSSETAGHLLRSTVRISVGSTTGTGVVLYSKHQPNSLDPRYYTYILTCAHVVAGASFFNPIIVENFHYLNGATIVAVTNYRAEIVAISREIDTAVIQVLSSMPLNDHVTIFPPNNFYSSKVYLPIYVVGCGLGKQPYITNGNVSSYWAEKNPDNHVTVDFPLQLSAPTIFGNSGGGVYDANGRLMGIIQTIAMVDASVAYPHISNAVPIWNIVLFLQEHKLDFIVGLGESNVEIFNNYRNTQQRFLNKRAEEQEFMQNLLEAIQKLAPVAPVTSVAPIVSSDPAPIVSSTKIWR